MIYKDCYYTPPEVADLVVKYLSNFKIFSCMDSACGNGELLAAVERAYPEVQCYGLDINRKTILELKHAHSGWIVSAGDFLSFSAKKTISVSKAIGCDVVVSNPPFSMGFNKTGHNIDLNDLSIKCSIAMAHTLTNLFVISPKLCMVAIVPESMLFSELDALAREVINRRFNIEILENIDRTVFRGANANALMIRIAPLPSFCDMSNRFQLHASKPSDPIFECTIIRGGLPVHEVKPVAEGMIYVHTTSIRSILAKRREDYIFVRPITRGIVWGVTILLPRVGLPMQSLLEVLFIEEPVQLSDCVIALIFKGKHEAMECLRIILDNYLSFKSIYRGTCARYVTVKRLEKWLQHYGISANIGSSYKNIELDEETKGTMVI